MEQTVKITPGEVITLACQRFLEKLLRRGELEAAFAQYASDDQNIAPATMNEQITEDGLDNLRVVKEAEADFLKQDLG